MPSFRRFRGVNVTGDEAPVKCWRREGHSCGIETVNGPAADAPEVEASGLEGEGKSGGA
jgi:hypothetical protein